MMDKISEHPKLLKIFSIAFILTGLFTVSSIFSQESSARSEIFAPFVSKLQVRVKDSEIKLTWEDSSDLQGQYKIYRHTAEINESNFSRSELIGIVDPGIGFFIDSPDDMQEYFYAVLGEDNSGKLYTLFVPFRNKTLRSVAVASLETETDVSARIVELKTTTEQGAIRIQFKPSRSDREVVIYRSTGPFKDMNDLAAATALTRLSSSQKQYADYPVPGIAYYYAVVDTEIIDKGWEHGFEAGINTSATYAQIPLGKFRIGLPTAPADASRQAPLPLISLNSEVTTGRPLTRGFSSGLPSPTQLSQEINNAVISIMSTLTLRPQEEMQARVLAIDSAATAEGSEATLKSILETDFAMKDWKNAEIKLQNLQTIYLEEDIKIRTFFYLGQCLFFQEKYEESFMAFMMAQEEYYTEVSPFLDRILERSTSSL